MRQQGIGVGLCGGAGDVERAKNKSEDASKNEQAKYKKELAMAKVFARNGRRMVLLRERPGIPSPDVTIDGVYADLKQTSSASNIVKYAKKAIRKQGADWTERYLNNNGTPTKYKWSSEISKVPQTDAEKSDFIDNKLKVKGSMNSIYGGTMAILLT